jgi:hypothetical protein
MQLNYIKKNMKQKLDKELFAKPNHLKSQSHY